jgi:hypothetical protein
MIYCSHFLQHEWWILGCCCDMIIGLPPPFADHHLRQQPVHPSWHHSSSWPALPATSQSQAQGPRWSAPGTARPADPTKRQSYVIRQSTHETCDTVKQWFDLCFQCMFNIVCVYSSTSILTLQLLHIDCRPRSEGQRGKQKGVSVPASHLATSPFHDEGHICEGKPYSIPYQGSYEIAPTAQAKVKVQATRVRYQQPWQDDVTKAQHGVATLVGCGQAWNPQEHWHELMATTSTSNLYPCKAAGTRGKTGRACGTRGHQ